MRILYGERIAKQGKILVGCTAVIFDGTRQKVVLTRRADNRQWCLPGGHMEAGESAAEACAREVKEETGLSVEVKRLIGIYTSPHRLIEYADGNKYHLVSLTFEAGVLRGELITSNETTEFGYFSLPDIYKIDLLQPHVERIEDAFQEREEGYVR